MEEIPPEEMEHCLQILQRIADTPGIIRRNDRFKGLISKIYKESKRDDQREERWRQRVEDRALQATTAMVQIQRDALSAAALPPPEASQ